MDTDPTIDRAIINQYLADHGNTDISYETVVDLLLRESHGTYSEPATNQGAIFRIKLLRLLEYLGQLVREKNDNFEQNCLGISERITNILDQLQGIRLEAYRVQSEISEAKLKLEGISSIKSNQLVNDYRELMLSKVNIETSLAEVKLDNLKQSYKQSLSASLLTEWQRLTRYELFREPVSANWLQKFHGQLFKSWCAYRDQLYQKFEMERKNVKIKSLILVDDDVCFQVLIEAFTHVITNFDPKFEDCLLMLTSRFSTSASSPGSLVRPASQTTEHLLNVFVDMSSSLDHFIVNLVDNTYHSPIHGVGFIQDERFRNFIHVLCATYQHLLLHYVKIESATLMSQLNNQLSQFEMTRNFNLVQIYSIAESSLDRAFKFVHFGTCASIIFTMKDFFGKFSTQLVNSISEIKQLAALSTGQRGSQPINWSLFHRTINMTITSSTALSRMMDFESKFQKSIEITRKKFDPVVPLIRKEGETYNFSSDQLVSYSTFLQIEYILRPNQRKDFYEVILAQSGDKEDDLVSGILFESCNSRLKSINKDLVDLLFSLIFDHISAHLRDGLRLDKLNREESKSLIGDQSAEPKTNSLMGYAFAPQPYITHIGQQLLVISKNIEPYANDNATLMRALGSTNDTSASLYFVRELSLKVVRAVLDIYQEYLPKLTSLGRRQFVTDMLYLDNVLNDLRVYRGTSNSTFESFKKIIAS